MSILFRALVVMSNWQWPKRCYITLASLPDKLGEPNGGMRHADTVSGIAVIVLLCIACFEAGAQYAMAGGVK